MSDTGPLRIGLPPQDVPRALAAPRTLEIHGRVIACDLRLNSWMSAAYFEQLLGRGLLDSGRVYFLDATTADGWGRSEPFLRLQPGDLIFSYTADDQVETLRHRLEQAVNHTGSIQALRPIEMGTEAPVVEVYEAILDWTSESATPREALDLRGTWKSGVQAGVWESRPGTGPALLPTLKDDDLASIYRLYQDSMAPLSLDHPESAEYSFDEYREMLRFAGCINLVAFEHGEIITHGCLLDDLSPLSDWLNLHWFHSRYAEKIDSRSLLYFPGIVTSKRHQRSGHISRVLAQLLDVLMRAGPPPAITFVCNNASRDYTPRIVDGIIASRDLEVKGRSHLVARYQWFGIQVEAA